MIDFKTVTEGVAVVGSGIGIFKMTYDFMRGKKKEKPSISVEVENVWDSAHVTFVNNGQVTIRLSGKFGIITPEGKNILIPDSVSDREYPYVLEPNKSFSCNIRLELINAHLRAEDSLGLVEITYFVRDTDNHIFTSKKAKFSAFDIRNLAGKTYQQVQWQWDSTQH